LAGPGLAWTYYTYPCSYYPYVTQCNM
jgi:hypothetical protein